MPLPSGVWKANVNGWEADLTTEAPTPQGAFVGQFMNAPIRGFWDENSQTITFTLPVFSDNQGMTTGAFRGHLFRTPINPEPGRDVIATLAGSLQMSAGSTGPGIFPAIPTSKRNAFGWLATIAEII